MYSIWRNLPRHEQQHTMKTALAALSAEVVGTGILMFLGCLGNITGFKSVISTDIQSAVAFGISVSAIIQIFGHVSGAHLNPAVTCAAWVWGSLSITLSFLYIIAQIMGAILGYGLLLLLTPDEVLELSRGANATGAFCGTAPHAKLQPEQAFFIEFFITSILIFLCCGCWDSRNSTKQDSVPLKFGALVAAISMTAGQYTGASMNPARTLAPSIFYNAWDSHWIYWVSPLAAGFGVTLLYRVVYRDSKCDPPAAAATAVPVSPSAVTTTTINYPSSKENLRLQELENGKTRY